MKHRVFKGLLGAVLVLFMQLALAGWPLPGGSINVGAPGFFPAGHWIASPTGLGLTLVYPQPDSSTQASARVHQAYWDGTNDIPYDQAIGVEFGAYPYVFQLLSGPPGMSIEQTYYNTFQNVQYGRLIWHPQGNISSAWSGTVTVLVTDQQLNTLTISYSLWTVGAYTTGSLTSATASTTNGSNVVTLTVTTGTAGPGMTLVAANIPTGSYITTQTSGTTGGTGNYDISQTATTTASGDSVTGSSGQGAVFVSATGSGSTCSYSTPCSLTTAFGPTFASTSYPGAIAYAASGTYSSTASTFVGGISGTTLTTSSGTPVIGENISGAGNTGVTEGTTITAGSGTSWTVSISQTVSTGTTFYGSNDLPAYTDTDTSTHGFEPYTARKPNALIGLPGATVTLDATGGPGNGVVGFPYLIQTGGHANDWYEENITANAYNQNDVAKLIILGSNRLTFDQVDWTNSGYGTAASNNESMFVSPGIQTPKQYLFITDSEETNRESDTVGNNGGFCDLYSFAYVLLQRSVESSPSSNLDWVFLFKSDITYSTVRENYADVQGTSDGGFGYVQSQYSGIGNDDTDYNLGVNVNKIWGNGAAGFTWQAIGIYRNTLVAGTGPGLVVTQTTYNLEGPGDGITSGPPSAANSGTSGSLSSSTQYTWCITSVGASGESACKIGSNGNASSGSVAGDSNQVSFTLGATTTSAQLSWLPEPGVTAGYNGYRELTSCGGGSGCWTEYSLGNVTTWNDTGAAGTSASPPANPGTAISAARWSLYENALSTSTGSPVPSGSTIQTTGSGITNPNVVDASTGTLICLNITSSGCNGTIGGVTQQIGDLNTTYSGSYGTFSSLTGQVGYRIQ